MTNEYGNGQWIDHEPEDPWIPGRKGDKGQGYGPSWKGQISDCPKLKDANGISFKNGPLTSADGQGGLGSRQKFDC